MIGFGQQTGCISGDCTNGYGTYVFGKGEFEGDKYVGYSKNNMCHGRMQKETIYKDGKEISSKCWDEDGNIIDEE